jgi:hypothetical protein
MKWEKISIQKCTAEVRQANLKKYLLKLKRLRNHSWGNNDFKETLFDKWQDSTKLCMKYSGCSSILIVLGNVPQYPGYPGYQLLEALIMIMKVVHSLPLKRKLLQSSPRTKKYILHQSLIWTFRRVNPNFKNFIYVWCYIYIFDVIFHFFNLVCMLSLSNWNSFDFTASIFDTWLSEYIYQEILT